MDMELLYAVLFLAALWGISLLENRWNPSK